MTPLRFRDALRRDDGIAMLFVMAIGLIVTGFVVASLASTLNTQNNARAHRNVTSAQAAAEAGLDDAVFQLGQLNPSGAANWGALPTSWTKTSPNTQSFGSNANYKVWLTTQAGTGNLIVWSQGTYASHTRTLRAVVAQGSPPAFGYSMFASKGIDIHHHGSSWLSPQVWTTDVHSNGYINLDYTSEFTVNNMEAVGALTMQKGGGSGPGGSLPAAGYNWYDPLNGKCFPGGMANPGGVAPTSLTPTVTCPNSYSGNATVAGTVKAGSFTLGSRGQVLPVPADVTMDTQQIIQHADGDVIAGSATIGGTSYTAANAASCTQCNKGASAQGGQISGALKITSGYAPPVIAFPSIDYSTTYRPKAQAEQDSTNVRHVFTGGGDFLTRITDVSYGAYKSLDANGNLSAWVAGSSTPPAVIFLDGTYDITAGSLQLNYTTLKGMVNAATGTNGPAPILMIRGSLVVEGGGITLNSGLVMMGQGNRTDGVVLPGTATTPPSINTAQLLDPGAAMPGVLAAGGTINSSDYDTDSPWSASCSCYEPAKATPIYIRGLVYSGLWNPTTGVSTPQNQHWHNYDPKNLMKIYGSQVGATLHDCNNFSFSYDPLVKKAFGFGGGTVSIIDYQELGT